MTRKTDLSERDKERNTVKNFMKWAQSKDAQAILNSGKSQHVQMDLLHDLMFGRRPAGPFGTGPHAHEFQEAQHLAGLDADAALPLGPALEIVDADCPAAQY